jgi:plasmid stabilization system protein ParE
MLNVVLTQRAQTSLEEITDYYLSEHTASRTIKVIESIEEAFELIARKPKNYPVCFDIKEPVENIRQIIVHNTFKIVYRIQKDKIEVLEIFHSKRNPVRLKDID